MESKTYRLLKQYDKSLEFVNKAIHMNRDDDFAYTFRGDLYKELIEIRGNGLMCDDYKRACDLGDCENFDKYCK